MANDGKFNYTAGEALAGTLDSARAAAPSIEEVLTAVREDNAILHRRCNQLERRLSRYDRAFERMFREEIEDRLYTSSAEKCVTSSPLDELSRKLRDMAEKEPRCGR